VSGVEERWRRLLTIHSIIGSHGSQDTLRKVLLFSESAAPQLFSENVTDGKASDIDSGRKEETQSNHGSGRWTDEGL
jgi:hypothetical protein